MWRDGRSRPHYAGRTPVQAALTLPSDVVLVRELNTPPLPDRDLRRMMALDIDRLTPFQAADVYLDVAASMTAPEAPGVRRILLGVIQRSTADRALIEAREAGLEPSALVASGVNGRALDFLPAMRAAGVFGRRRRATVLWWSAVATLVLLNVGCWIWRDERDLAALQAVVAAQQPQVQHAVAVRATFLAEAQRRQALRASLAADEPLRALDAANPRDSQWGLGATRNNLQ